MRQYLPSLFYDIFKIVLLGCVVIILCIFRAFFICHLHMVH